ncbi:MAG: hypothetical protein A3H59_02925 [Candidatus Jacksonbacteria bacterium RIFCSPLOWO2_02_FULL_43_9]|nr:MAG: hypothetical protein UV70_C0003G0047 [Parcubacteria group bacterium GW2011_GWA2_43_13]OGY69369.1 MAG: hypothetical protein A3B94_03595 [Candidatus Jacksonbacteria bacterium RIFCSPHIGHO2_02_FULL_43_10]OGY70574.1 MAG: hypothetical protein A2986_02595 [Candidatus Jacksonbacteria bacterium RIFCSPLOWO2_01_FULL_44_13]OGY74154.1 MAG: hypothetical protein A3H59_02925 [Candidatus Jacksonbacteria bacterium RIFCSPLOWO2_02_FULL_43_9]HAZ16351.1 hypothetical protein [Candidatus Jacksonbacteria bacter
MWGNPWPELIDARILWDRRTGNVCAIMLFSCLPQGVYIITEYIGMCEATIPEIYSDPHHFGMHVGYAEDSQEARRIFDGQIAYRKGFKAAKPEEWDVVYEQQWRELEDVHRHGVVQFTVTVAGDHFLPSIGISDVLMLGV